VILSKFTRRFEILKLKLFWLICETDLRQLKNNNKIKNGCSKTVRIGHNLLWYSKRRGRKNFKVAENQAGRPLSEKKEGTRKLGQIPAMKYGTQ
jgi:hypothetical protein